MPNGAAGHKSISVGQLIFAIVGAVATAGAIWTWGFMVGDNAGDTTLQFMKEQNEALKEESTRLQSELTTVKLDLERSKDSEAAVTPAEEEPDSETLSPSAVKVAVDENSSADAFGGELLVSLVGTGYEGSPLHYTVTATFNAKGEETFHMKAVDPGFRARYEDFEITVVSADSSSAVFSIEKIEAAPKPVPAADR